MELIKLCILAAMGICALAVPVTIALYRALTDRSPAPPVEEHDHETCRPCAELRHPANGAARAALGSLPRPRLGGMA
ncbi:MULTISPECIES: hypothetical protein [unclassified Streptomyces]|uniref:hypothetical protein n=1 Tax=unclassified Streptomyces TaxID=2593676 RepID=UPI00037DDB37|nr:MULTISPECIES: hypothetical protein [unclassified Streptomyces]MYX33462.1 hypothetical protein [Streptomyces sp. SID8377]